MTLGGCDFAHTNDSHGLIRRRNDTRRDTNTLATVYGIPISGLPQKNTQLISQSRTNRLHCMHSLHGRWQLIGFSTVHLVRRSSTHKSYENISRSTCEAYFRLMLLPDVQYNWNCGISWMSSSEQSKIFNWIQFTLFALCVLKYFPKAKTKNSHLICIL